VTNNRKKHCSCSVAVSQPEDLLCDWRLCSASTSRSVWLCPFLRGLARIGEEGWLPFASVLRLPRLQNPERGLRGSSWFLFTDKPNCPKPQQSGMWKIKVFGFRCLYVLTLHLCHASPSPVVTQKRWYESRAWFWYEVICYISFRIFCKTGPNTSIKPETKLEKISDVMRVMWSAFQEKHFTQPYF